MRTLKANYNNAASRWLTLAFIISIVIKAALLIKQKKTLGGNYVEKKNFFDRSVRGYVCAVPDCVDTCQLICAEAVAQPHRHLSTAALRGLPTPARLYVSDLHVRLSTILLQFVLLERLWIPATVLCNAVLFVPILAAELQ